MPSPVSNIYKYLAKLALIVRQRLERLVRSFHRVDIADHLQNIHPARSYQIDNVHKIGLKRIAGAVNVQLLFKQNRVQEGCLLLAVSNQDYRAGKRRAVDAV